MTKLHTNKMTSRRAVAPVIATLLLVAIAVVGGSIIFVFSQGFFSSAQISGSPQIESIKILGYDATDGGIMQYHDGVLSSGTITSGPAPSDGLNTGEYIAIYVKNDSVNKVTFSEIRIAGTVYDYDEMSTASPSGLTNSVAPACLAVNDDQLDCTEYTLVVQGFDAVANVNGVLIDTAAPELQPGQEATIVVALDKDIKTGRDMQFKLSTSAGAVFVSTLNSGQQSG